MAKYFDNRTPETLSVLYNFLVRYHLQHVHSWSPGAVAGGERVHRGKKYVVARCVCQCFISAHYRMGPHHAGHISKAVRVMPIIYQVDG